MSGPYKNRHYLNLTRIKSARARERLCRLYDRYYAAEQLREIGERKLCTICEDVERKPGYALCESCQRFKQVVDRVVLQNKAAGKLNMFQRKTIIQRLAAAHGATCRQYIARQTALFIGFRYPAEYFRLSQATAITEMLHPSNVVFFRTLSACRTYTTTAVREKRKRREKFKRWRNRIDEA